MKQISLCRWTLRCSTQCCTLAIFILAILSIASHLAWTHVRWSSRLENEGVLTSDSLPTPKPSFLTLPDNLTYITGCDECPNYPALVPAARGVSSSTAQRDIRIVFFNRPGWVCRLKPDLRDLFENCTYKCSMTTNRSAMATARAVVFEVSALSNRFPPRRPQNNGQIWIAFSMESPSHFSDSYKRPAWRGVFNWTMTYRTDSDIFIPYNLLSPRIIKTPKEKNYRKIAAGKNKTAFWIVSNCHTQSKRMRYVNELKKYIDVDVYGACGKLECPKTSNWGPYEAFDKCLVRLSSPYFFYLAFESALCPDYVTEKFFKIFNVDVDVIPVVRGGADYGRYFPRQAIIDTNDFPSPRKLAQSLVALTADLDRYAAVLKAKDEFQFRPSDWFCPLCQKLHSLPSPARTYWDLRQWVNKGKCRSPRYFP